MAKMQLCLDINEVGRGSWKAEMPKDSVLSRPGKAIFEPGISLLFSKTGRTVSDDSSMRTLLVTVSDSTHSHSILHTSFGLCVCVLGNVTKQIFSPASFS